MKMIKYSHLICHFVYVLNIIRVIANLFAFIADAQFI